MIDQTTRQVTVRGEEGLERGDNEIARDLGAQILSLAEEKSYNVLQLEVRLSDWEYTQLLPEARGYDDTFLKTYQVTFHYAWNERNFFHPPYAPPKLNTGFSLSSRLLDLKIDKQRQEGAARHYKQALERAKSTWGYKLYLFVGETKRRLFKLLHVC